VNSLTVAPNLDATNGILQVQDQQPAKVAVI
jgi:hypothetical protein